MEKMSSCVLLILPLFPEHLSPGSPSTGLNPRFQGKVLLLDLGPSSPRLRQGGAKMVGECCQDLWRTKAWRCLAVNIKVIRIVANALNDRIAMHRVQLDISMLVSLLNGYLGTACTFLLKVYLLTVYENMLCVTIDSGCRAGQAARAP